MPKKLTEKSISHSSEEDQHWPKCVRLFGKTIYSCMRLFKKIKKGTQIRDNWLNFITIIAIALAFVGGISVMGVIQSTERIGTSGIVTIPPPPILPPPSSSSSSNPSNTPDSSSSEPAVEIGIYSDANCMNMMSAIEWGSIEAGGSINKVVYVKNIGEENVILSLDTQNWNPLEAINYLELSWNYDGRTLNPGNIIEITLILTVDESITEIETFSFDVVLAGSTP